MRWIEHVAKIVERYPDALAVICHDEQLTDEPHLSRGSQPQLIRAKNKQHRHPSGNLQTVTRIG